MPGMPAGKEPPTPSAEAFKPLEAPTRSAAGASEREKFVGFLAASVFSPHTQRLRNTALKVACDQTFGAGSFNLIFFSQTALMEGGGLREAVERVRTQWWPQMKRHWCFWPWFHSINFFYSPLHLRVLWQNLALVGWSALLSRIGAAASAQQAVAARAAGN